MEGRSSEDEDASSTERWTCEACGCNTNQQSDSSCTICGTSNSSFSILRRHGAAYAARAGFLARRSHRSAEVMDAMEAMDEDDDLLEAMVDNMAAVAAVGDLDSRLLGHARLVSAANGRRLLEAARALTQQPRTPAPDPNLILRIATSNGLSYNPTWISPSDLVAPRGRRSQQTEHIQVGEGERQHIAYSPIGTGEDRAVRAETPLPRDSDGSILASPPNPRRAFGFRVAFDLPSVEKGASMGGGHWIGVATSSYTGYHEPNSLEKSPFFWGVEDTGQKCEGSTSSTAAAFRSTTAGERRNVSMNSANTLFGCRDVVTVVCDYETGTLTFWRNEALLGSLVSNLPPSGDLFPVVVPSNSGAAVAITGITEDPLSLLRAFSSDCLRNRQRKEGELRQKLLRRRSRLIQGGDLTKEMNGVLKEIFLMYTENSEQQISFAMAHRLWYRCGLRLSSLNDILAEKEQNNGKVDFLDFLSVVCQVVAADVAENEPTRNVVGSIESFCEVGDKVELVEGYEKLSDSAGGPLQPGDRASVIEIQRGSNGERRSIRVLHSGRRWWYQPQAIVSERSGLIDSAAVWFLSTLLRAHGYDADTLESMQGKQVTTSSWLIGDVVIPKKPREEATSRDASAGVWCGRVVPESHSSRTPCTPHSRDAGTILVEFVGGAFAQSVGLKLAGPASSDQAHTLFVRRVRASKLLHSSALHYRDYSSADELFDSGDERIEGSTEIISAVLPIGEKLSSEIAAVGRLEQLAIELIAKECKRNPEALPGLFGAGLPSAVLSAVDIAAKQTNSLEPREDLSEKITAIGVLLKTLSEKLYSDDSDVECDSSENEEMDNETICSDQGHFSSQQLMFASGDHAARAMSPSRRDTINDMGSNMDIVDRSLRQRRGMLSVLLSRERYRAGSSLHELGERRRFVDLDDTRPFGVGSRPFVFGLPAESPNSSEEHWGTIRSQADVNPPETSTTPVEASVLDALLRCRGISSETVDSSLRQGSPSLFLFIRQLVSCGILVDSKEWTQALLDSFQSKKTPLQKSTKTALRSAVDEDGIPVLRLAILMGCSPAVIRILISFGAPVGPDELRKAAYTNQPETLAVLLQYSSFTSDTISNEQCSPEVRELLRKAKARQNELDRQMREAAGDFVASVVKKLVLLGLSTRRNPSPRTAVCNQVVSRILVGDIILEALQRAQKRSTGSGRVVETKDEADRSGRVPLDDGMQSLIPGGVLRLLPVSVLGETLFSDQESATTFFLLLEDYLCSKDLSDTAAGLAMYKVFLANFPQLRSSSLLDRFGFNELVSFHDSLASNRISEILSRDFASGLDVSTETKSESAIIGIPQKREEVGVVTCPKKHTAMLHITRHSSFRCDICGVGVERGKPMHGCRECDWDACEECTDKSESGLIKCNAIRQLAREALRLSSEDVTDSEMEEKMSDFPHGDVVEEMANEDVSTPLNVIVSKLLQRDVEAMRDLGVLLLERGRVSFYQFLCFVLPALHESLSGKPSHNDTSIAARSSRKTKKPRCSEGSTIAPGALFEHCRDSIAFLLDSPSQNQSPLETSDTGGNVRSRALDSSKEIAYSTLGSELLRRIHQVLTLHENVREASTSTQTLDVAGGDKGRSDLHALTKTIEIQIRKENQEEESLSFLAEPLISMSDLEMQILRSSRIEDSTYLSFCRSLATDTAIIVERARTPLADSWRIAMVTGFDEKTGAHSMRCASKLFTTPMSDEVVLNTSLLEDEIIFDQETIDLILAVREFAVVKRHSNVQMKQVSISANAVQVDKVAVASNFDGSNLSTVIGQRVERIPAGGGKTVVLTLIGLDVDPASSSESNLLAILVSDDGVVIRDVPAAEVHSLQDRDPSTDQDEGGQSGSRALLRRGLPYPFAARRRSTENPVAAGRKLCLRRTWSAISLTSNLRPLDIKIPEIVTNRPDPELQNRDGDRWWPCQVDTANLLLYGDASTVETPPKISVIITARDKMGHPSVVANRTDSLAQTLMSLSQAHGTDWPSQSLCKLNFTVNVECDPSRAANLSKIAASTPPPPQRKFSSREVLREHGFNEQMEWSPDRTSRSRKVSARSPSLEVEGMGEVLCNGLDASCLQCMEVIRILAQHTSDTSEGTEMDRPNIPRFANQTLSKKLSSQLDDALCVVGGALPRWCTYGPAFSPRVFSYASRQLLLRRAAFGVSRGILKQQECKIDVGKLRQRMGALRARAVELMGEAFSGGAEDPTALQLQADELYGMEEALAARVRSAFRSAKWQEHSLEVVKAAVRREKLLLDAAHVMDKYATDSKINKRRLEVRFVGESGFDAASGDEAGVTRGFYADVAEALLNSETVASVLPSSQCDIIPTEAESIFSSTVAFGQTDNENSRLPLWIPDMDASGQVVIPTPRADTRSCLGVYPRPLPSYHPRLPEVQQVFRFMGRLFAAAIRDGFMFPLPISASFLRLVQCAPEESDSGLTDSKLLPSGDVLLTSADLPRPGFLGGEVHAADVHICRALDDLDSSEPPLTSVELQRRYRELAEDKNFARNAFGMSYDCSFEEYFQDRTFVDPLDPTQGDEAVRLCHRGHKKAVTIYNIREWVALSKNFILFDGVAMQATAFRQGIEDFFPSKFLRLFTSEELQRDVCGAGDNVDDWDEGAIRKLFKLNGGKGATEALVAVAAIGGEGGAALSRRFGPSSPTISFLVKALLEANPKQRRQFLSFVTSVPIVTPGRIEIVPIVSPIGEFLPVHDPSCLPRANTCARRLYLPKFDTYESFAQVVWAVVEEESRFKGFYEWRGSNT